MSKCYCCGSEQKDNGKCAYCGLPEEIILEEDVLAQYIEDLKEELPKYRAQKIAPLKNFRVRTFQYEKLALADFTAKERAVAFGDGSELDGKTVWSKEQFAQSPGPGQHALQIFYDVNGKIRQLEVPIALPQTQDFWRLALEISTDLHLRVLLGDKDNHTTAEHLPLELL